MGAGGNATTKDSSVALAAPVSGKEIIDRAPSVRCPGSLTPDEASC